MLPVQYNPYDTVAAGLQQEARGTSKDFQYRAVRNTSVLRKCVCCYAGTRLFGCSDAHYCTTEQPNSVLRTSSPGIRSLGLLGNSFRLMIMNPNKTRNRHPTHTEPLSLAKKNMLDVVLICCSTYCRIAFEAPGRTRMYCDVFSERSEADYAKIEREVDSLNSACHGKSGLGQPATFEEDLAAIEESGLEAATGIKRMRCGSGISRISDFGGRR